jgi:hypothetical protein
MNFENDLDFIKSYADFTDHNYTKLDIYEGNLLPYVKDVMKKTLSPNYYNSIEHRIVPINVLTRIMDKLSGVYINPPIRTDQNNQDQLTFLEREMEVNLNMTIADVYANLFKGYAIEPFLDRGIPRMRILPFDQFLVRSEDRVNPMRVTTFYKFMGRRYFNGKQRELYFKYTDNTFDAFFSDGEIYSEAYIGNDGFNPYGVIPFVYANRSKQNLIPKIDTDIKQMSLILPTILSDLGGSVMFQCFSIIYGIDVNAENLTATPNAFWSLQSDKTSDKQPQIGTITPSADVGKVLEYIKNIFVLWLETKGVRIGSLQTLNSTMNASGISKIIDEMDVYNIRKQSISHFKKEESEFWQLMKVMNNHWVTSDNDYVGELIGDDFDPLVIFEEPKQDISRRELVEIVKMEYDNKFLPAKNAIMELYPDLTMEEIDERVQTLEGSNGLDENESQDT